MRPVFVITASEDFANSLKRMLAHLRGIQAISIVLPDMIPPLNPQADTSRQEDKMVKVLRMFHSVADAMEREADWEKGSGLRNAVAIVEFFEKEFISIPSYGQREAFSPVHHIATWGAALAMLVLAFPEVHWVFWSTQPLNLLKGFQVHAWLPIPIRDQGENKLLDLLKYHDIGYRPLFDPIGLRNCIRCEIRKQISQEKQVQDEKQKEEHVQDEKEKDEQEKRKYPPLRKEVAASIEDEGAYAYMHAYIAYRFGYRCHMVTTTAYMTKLFGREKEERDQRLHNSDCPCMTIEHDGERGQNITSKMSPCMTTEDLFLNFPDRRENEHYTDLEGKRDSQFPGLKEVRHRVFVTVGHKHAIPQERWSENRRYLRENWNSNDGKRHKILYKPLAGIYNFKSEARIKEGEGFRWPPKPPQSTDSEGDHSAPGRLLVIAERLIKRAEKVLETSTTVEDSIYGALLALEAQELLGNRTPTTALEALAVRQQLEVIAECMFYGVEAHLNVKDRFQEIEREVRSIGTWFNPTTRKAAELNAQIGIINKLTTRFREHNQFDEEQKCLGEARKLERCLGLYNPNGWARLMAWVAFPFRWYVELLLSSIRWFVFALVGWIAFFTIAFRYCCNCVNEDKGGNTITHSLADAISSFVGLQPPHGLNDMLSRSGWALWLSMLAIILGFVHLGIFISHLYSIIARR